MLHGHAGRPGDFQAGVAQQVPLAHMPSRVGLSDYRAGEGERQLWRWARALHSEFAFHLEEGERASPGNPG